jgi:uncharacterized membrane protein
MIPFVILAAGVLLFRVLVFESWTVSLRAAFVPMLLLTASAHWGKRRPDLVRMVPPFFPRPELLVTVTGMLELLGAIGLLIPATSRAAATCLAILLLAMFPANVYAARHRLSIAGREATALPLRAIMQVVFVGALLVAGWA